MRKQQNPDVPCCLTHRPLGAVQIIVKKMQFSHLCYRLNPWALLVKLLPGACHITHPIWWVNLGSGNSLGSSLTQIYVAIWCHYATVSWHVCTHIKYLLLLRIHSVESPSKVDPPVEYIVWIIYVCFVPRILPVFAVRPKYQHHFFYLCQKYHLKDTNKFFKKFHVGWKLEWGL